MAPPNHDGGEGVVGRKLVFCPRLEEFETKELIVTCENCTGYLLYCCSHSSDSSKVSKKPCHHFRLIFTDGACKNNGADNATAGIGVAIGDHENYQLDLPVTSVMDPNQKRTSQRAELLAAIYGLRFFARSDTTSTEAEATEKAKKWKKRNPEKPLSTWIITSDSEYLVKGMTEWLPAWKNNDMRNGQNKRSTNLDLFVRLDQVINSYEKKYDVKIGFWHVPRKYNEVADELAKKAALKGEPCAVGHSLTK